MEHPQSDGRLGKRCLGELRIRPFVRALPLLGVTPWSGQGQRDVYSPGRSPCRRDNRRVHRSTRSGVVVERWTPLGQCSEMSPDEFIIGWTVDLYLAHAPPG
jgi:hypothetical protein